jgi:A/G-specific adenine glycosylase
MRWYGANRRDLPWRRTNDPYAILVSEVMLQQTQVKTVIAYYRRWMETFPDAASLAAAPESKVLKFWEGLGYYRRARNLQAAAREITGRGGFPNTIEGLLALPGIGRYTAGAVGSIAFGLKLAVVDGNVSRVLARFLGIKAMVKSAEVQQKLWAWMQNAIPEKSPGDFNQAMMELGAVVCQVRNPMCEDCPLREGCRARRNGWQDQLPRTEKIETVGRVESAVLIRNNGKIWLARRGTGEWHEGLWALPSVLHRVPEADWMADFNRRFRTKLHAARVLHSARYQVTRHRIELRVFETRAAYGSAGRLRPWSLAELRDLPMVTAHRKSLESLSVI